MVIVDDLEPPVLSYIEPNADFSLYPGETFNIAGIANDNIYIDKLNAYLVNENEEIPLQWETFVRTDRVEQIRLASAASFGSVLAAERFFVDYNGRIRIPKGFLNRAGETYDVVVRTTDFGVNQTDFGSVKLTILADDEPPVILFGDDPDDTIIDRQDFRFEATITDNIFVSSYRISVLDTQTRELVSEDDITAASVSIRENNIIDLTRYVPLPEDGVDLSIIISATDTSGNEASNSRLLSVLPDQVPDISLVSNVPQDNLTKGSPLFTRVRVTDDLLVNSQTRYIPLLSSLSGLDNPEGRNLRQSSSRQTGPDGPLVNQVAFNYPESNQFNGQLLINGERYWLFENGQSTLFPGVDTAGVNSLQLEINGNSVSYQIEIFSEDLCSAEHQIITVTESDLLATNGELNLNRYSRGTSRFVVTPIINGVLNSETAFLKKIIIHGSDTPRTLNYQFEDIDRNASESNPIQLIVSDNDSPQGVGVLSLATELVLSENTQDFETYWPSVVENGIDQVSLYAGASDRFSDIRDEQALTRLLEMPLIIDESDPSLRIQSPLDGTLVVPGETIEIEVVTTDDSEGIKTIELHDGSGLVAELSGVYQQEGEYTFQYDVPERQLTGDLVLTVISEDFSGRRSSSQIALPIDINQSPDLEYSSFSSYLVNGRYQRVITDPERINFGQFFIRTGETFRLNTRLSDDAGLVRYEINRLNLSLIHI